ncbi:uncharacterized protein APUU_20359A [Aspergillus puulaauensis]|uniref:Zn(2)-C6 fungal-type domain-containing protein n=1 Tax=Aspergillus puulaauensis TaxID=1220207 RepID=A0A7R7XEG2_9EURO|nr:uncharacterized protein APUU_20359A [Aspergillus puulaauensis]BCS19927.1 hypothetical protein APUU_20359A [Aspergillus puulaauensis]
MVDITSRVSPRLSRTPESAASCRTCRNCRRRKVKCNGQQPKCGTCQSRGIDCVYPRDARRTVVRAKQADVRSLQSKIESLQGRLEALTQSPSVGESQAPLLPSRTVPVTPSPSEIRGRNIDKAHSPEPGLGDDGPQVYGATSLLHDQSSDTPLANQKIGDVETGLLSDETIKDKLISNAAIRRQEELSLSSTPSIAANIDFDGVPMDLAMHLLDLHWNRQHLSYLLTYRPAIMDSLIRNGPYVNKLLLNAIFLQSSMYSDRVSPFFGHQQSNAKGLIFYDRFKALLPNYIDKPTIATVVALLTAAACLIPYGYQSAGWALSGIGYQMVIDLGCHLDSPASSKANSIEQEMKKRVYWAAFVGDKLQSLFLGRPIAMHATTGNVTQVYLDTFEEMEEWTPYIDPVAYVDTRIPVYRGRPSRAISTFQAFVQLCEIAGHIIESFYSVSSRAKSESTLLQIKHDVTMQLTIWWEKLPSWLRFDPGVDSTPPPHQITPHALYWTLVILTEQAFLSRGCFDFILSPDSAEVSRQRCIQAALSIWKLVEAYKQAFTLRRAQYGISYATYCAVQVMLQHTHHDNHEYVGCIRFFWSALWEYQRGCCYGLTRPLKLLRSLMRRLESVPDYVEADGPVGNWPAPAEAGQPPLNPEVNLGFELEPWDVSLLSGIPDELLVDDTIFGIFGG